MLTLDIQVQGEKRFDLEVALEIIIRQIEHDFTSGHDRNNAGRYLWTMREE